MQSEKWKTLTVTLHFALFTRHFALHHSSQLGKMLFGRPQLALLANQNEDGSWPMTSRTAKDQVPIIDFGSAWATLGLTRTVPK